MREKLPVTRTSDFNFICPKCDMVLLHVDENVRMSPGQLQILSKLKTCSKCSHGISLEDLLRTATHQEPRTFTAPENRL